MPYHQARNYVEEDLPFQDNDPKHSSNLCKKYLKTKERQGELQLMAFPLQSPDVNPIENLWDHLKREKMRHTVTSKDMLWAVLWNNIEQSHCTNL